MADPKTGGMSGGISGMSGSAIGEDKKYQNPMEKFDAEQGTYKDNVDGMSDDSRWPSGSLPEGKDPAPFTLKK